MAAQHELGKMGEELAAAYLVQQGFKLLHRNWRSSHQEIDLIAEKEGRLHFIEVKFRSSTRFGAPELSVNRRKFANLKLAAEQYLLKHKNYRYVQFDILTIVKKGDEVEYGWVRDVWF